MLANAKPVDTKFIQAPTGVGKDLLPFALAVITKKVQLVFVPFVALVSTIVHEGTKYGCTVVKFMDIYKTVSIESAAAAADIIVLSYEHCSKSVRLAQELARRNRLGWCFVNEAHVAILDGDWRDFANLSDISHHCPQICCMSATIQPDLLSELAGKFGRTAFSESIWMPPNRASLSLVLRITSDTRSFISGEIRSQKQGHRAIVFCLFKSNVPQIAAYIQSAIPNRRVFQCTSGKASDYTLFNASDSAIMVCTTVLATGVSFEKVSRVYFLECSHGPEVFLQGAGRGARCDGESCIATLVTNRQQLETFQESPNMASAARMASFLLKCIDGDLNFGDEICRLFDHSEKENLLSNGLVLESTITPLQISNSCPISQLQVTVCSTSNPAAPQPHPLIRTLLSNHITI